MTTWIAEDRVVFVTPAGARIDGRIAIGLPEQSATGEWACPVALDGFDSSRVGPILGESSLQALLLAARFLATRLGHAVSCGYRIEHVDDDSDDDVEYDPRVVFGALYGESR